ncbi:FAD/NAD(P)-binding domain-containing protein [Aspergillus pseudoustus]|uniref:FAD/NAD(P)-binding domain-containing protein n=1 Tax=Aspergillus pseudoustus TaxID=1810923 RepID=A0ABR4K688_9EURO
MTKTPPPKNPLDIIIVGGSLTALMHGITLHRLGHNVHILEQSPTAAPTSHMAGIVLSPHVIAFLDRFDRVVDTALGFPCAPPKAHGYPYPSPHAGRLITSWGALYFRLRANFGGLSSAYIPQPPDVVCLEGEDVKSARCRAIYEHEKRVIDVNQSGNSKVSVVVQDLPLRQTRTLLADLVIGADGAHSIVRKSFAGEAAVSRRYAGYVVWRGVVLESAVSEETRDAIRGTTMHPFSSPEVGQAVLYTVPGPTGSLTPGTRNINFVWYFKTPASSLPKLMTDKDGHGHRTTVPEGLVNPAIWSSQVRLGTTLLPRAHAEILSKIRSPFIHAITDSVLPACTQASFLDGRVLLVGDALACLRPHIGYSTSVAALEAGLVEELVKGEIGVDEWGRRVTALAYLHWCRGIWYGHSYLRPGSRWEVMASAVRYWVVLVLYWMWEVSGWW